MTDPSSKALVLYQPPRYLEVVEVEVTADERRAFAERFLKAFIPAAILELQALPIEDVRKAAVHATEVLAREMSRAPSQKRTALEAWDVFGVVLSGIAAYAFTAGGVDLLGEHFEGQHVSGPLDLDGEIALAFLRAVGVTIGQS